MNANTDAAQSRSRDMYYLENEHKGATMTPKTTELAAKLREHAWLARFRKGDNSLSPFACQEIARHVDELIAAALAERVPADEGEAVTAAKAESILADASVMMRVRDGVFMVTIESVLFPRTTADVRAIAAVAKLTVIPKSLHEPHRG